MWIDRVPSTTSCFPYLEDNSSSSSVTAPSLLTSLFDKKHTKSRDSTNNVSYPYVLKDSRHSSTLALKVPHDPFRRRIDKTQPLIVESTHLNDNSTKSYRPVFPQRASSLQSVYVQNPQRFIHHHRTKQLPVEKLKTFHPPTLLRQQGEILSIKEPKKHWETTKNKETLSSLTSPTDYRKSSKIFHTSVTPQIQRYYRCLAIEVLKLWISRYHTFAKLFFRLLLSSTQRTVPYHLPASSSAVSHHSPWPQHEYNFVSKERLRLKSMACVFFKHLIVLISKNRFPNIKKQCLWTLKLYRNANDKRKIIHEENEPAPLPFSYFEAFQLERGIRCTENVLLKVIFREIRLFVTPVVEWSTIRPIIQQLTNMAEEHLTQYGHPSMNESIETSGISSMKNKTLRFDTARILPHPSRSLAVLSPRTESSTEKGSFSTMNNVLDSNRQKPYTDNATNGDPKFSVTRRDSLVTCAASLIKNETLLSPSSMTSFSTLPLPHENPPRVVAPSLNLFPVNISNRRVDTANQQPHLQMKLSFSPAKIMPQEKSIESFHNESNESFANVFPPPPSLMPSQEPLRQSMTQTHSIESSSVLPSPEYVAQTSPSRQIKTPHFLNSFRSPPATQTSLPNAHELSRTISSYSVIQDIIQGSFFVKYSKKRGRVSRRYVWIDLANGLFCWANSKPETMSSTSLSFVETPMTPPPPPTDVTHIKRKRHQGLSKYLNPFHRVKSADVHLGTPSEPELNSFYRTNHQNDIPNNVSRCYSTLGISNLTSTPSFITGGGNQGAALSQIIKIAYTWIHSPQPAVALIRKSIMLKPSERPTRDPMNEKITSMATQCAHIPKAVHCLTFVVVFRSSPSRSKSFLQNTKLSSMFSRNSSMNTQDGLDFLQLTCFTEKQLYTWLIGLHLLATSYGVTYPSLHLPCHVQNCLSSICINSCMKKSSQDVLVRFMARLRWIRACRHIRSLRMHPNFVFATT